MKLSSSEEEGSDGSPTSGRSSSSESVLVSSSDGIGGSSWLESTPASVGRISAGVDSADSLGLDVALGLVLRPIRGGMPEVRSAGARAGLGAAGVFLGLGTLVVRWAWSGTSAELLSAVVLVIIVGR
jgi:hypothetical protein